MATSLPIRLSDAEIEEFGREVGAIENEVKSDLGESDARYIRRLIKIQRSLALGGRLAIFVSLVFLPTRSGPGCRH
jgi:linoleoyl-CoA desaturase